MTNLEAISALLYPYDVDHTLLMKACVDGGIIIDDEYGIEMREAAAKAAISILRQLIVLSNESDGGYSLSYNVEKLEKRIASLAEEFELKEIAEAYSTKSRLIDCTNRW